MMRESFALALDQSREQLRDQIRASIDAARDAAREAAREAAQQAAQAAQAAQQAQPAQAAQAAQAASDAAQQAAAQAAEASAQATQNAIEAAQRAVEATQDFPPPPLPPDFDPNIFMPHIPQEAVVISIAFFIMVAFIIVGWPIARAIARRADRQFAAPEPLPDIAHRLERIEQAVESIAIEVERVSEGQRFSNKIVSELRALPQPNPMNAREIEELQRVRREHAR